jgi:hypothetical protein
VAQADGVGNWGGKAARLGTGRCVSTRLGATSVVDRAIVRPRARAPRQVLDLGVEVLLQVRPRGGGAREEREPEREAGAPPAAVTAALIAAGARSS